MSVTVTTPTRADLHGELAHLLRALPYCWEELEDLAQTYQLRPAEQRAYDRIRDLRFLLGED